MNIRRVTLYSRPGCHLCERVKAVVASVARTRPLEVCEVDISGNPDLERQYGHDIPVVAIDGRVVARHRVTEAELAELVG
jgi:glutaredoxin